MGYREFIGTRLLAIIVLVPAMFLLALFLESDSWWWLAAAVAYPPASLWLILKYTPDDAPRRVKQQP